MWLVQKPWNEPVINVTTTQQPNNQKNNTQPQDKDLIWQKYSNLSAGISLKYPPNTILSNTKNPDKLNLSITMNNIDTYEDGTLGYNKETAIKDQSSLEKGNFGETIDWPLEQSKTVYKIGANKAQQKQVNAKDFLVLGRFDVCDTVFERKLIFYNFGDQIIITLSAPKEKIISSMPQYFGKTENCGSIIAWKNFNPPTSQDQFYQKLTNEQGSGVAQEWYDTFDKIVETISVQF